MARPKTMTDEELRISRAASQRKWKDENRERVKELKREHYWKNPEDMRQKQKDWRRDNPYRALQMDLCEGAKRRAKDQGVPIDITLDDIVIPEFCPIFKKVRLARNDKPYAHASSPTLDKIVPELGYVKGNIQVISSRANIAKGSLSLEELREFGEWCRTLD